MSSAIESVKRIGRVVAEHRTQKGLSQAQLAEQLSFPRTTLALLEQGQRLPAPARLGRARGGRLVGGHAEGEGSGIRLGPAIGREAHPKRRNNAFHCAIFDPFAGAGKPRRQPRRKSPVDMGDAACTVRFPRLSVNVCKSIGFAMFLFLLLSLMS